LIPDALPTVLVGLGILTFGFLGTHGVLTAWVVETAHRAGRSTTGTSSAYLLVYDLGSTVAGTASTSLWSAGGWPAITILALVFSGVPGALVATLRVKAASGRQPRTRH
jgi:YNFM family putative membrane transporter